MSKLFGGLGPATANPMGVAASAKPLNGKFRIAGVITRENGEPVAGISLGLGGVECVTDEQGQFTLEIEKKS